MTDISDKIQQLKNLSGIFTGAGGDRIPPHGTTHTKNGPDPIPSELDGIPVDLGGMSTGETIVLDANGELVPGAPLGSLVALQTAYDNGGSVTLNAEDLTIRLGNSKKLIFKDKDGNAAFTFEDVGADNRITINPDILKLKDSNITTAIDLSSIGNVEFTTTDKSIVGAVNELAAAAVNYFNKLTDDSDDITEGTTNLFLTAAERAAIAGAYIKATDDATDIQMEVGNHDIQHLLDDLVGRGSIEGFGFTDNGGGSCTIAAGDVYIHTTASKGSTGGVFTVPSASFTLTDNANNYIYAEYNGGSPRLQATVNPTAIRYVEDKIIVAFIRRDGTTLRQVPFGSGWQSIHTLLSQRFFEQAEGEGDTFARRLKGDIISTLGTRNPTISAGVYGAGTNRIETPVIDCTAGGTFTQFYGDTTNGFTYVTGQTQLNNTQYYNGTGSLATLNTARYSVRWVWRLFSVTELYINISATNIIDLADAIDSPVPTDVPPLIAQFGQLVGRYIVQQGSNVVTSLPRWETTLSSSGVVTHAATVDKNSEAAFQHYNSALTASGQTGVGITTTAVSGSTSEFAVRQRDVTLLGSIAITTVASPTSIAANSRYIFLQEEIASDVIKRIDRLTGNVLQSYAGDTNWGGRGLLCSESKLYNVNSNYISEINPENLEEYYTITATGLTGYFYRGSALLSNGDIWNIENSTNDLQIAVRGSLSYTVTDYALTNTTGNLYGLALDATETYFYCFDDGNNVVRKYNASTRAYVSSSAVLSSGFVRGGLVVRGSYVYVQLSSGMYVLKTSDLTTAFTGAVAISATARGFVDGLMLSGGSTTLSIHQLPALTTLIKGFVDMQLDGAQIVSEGKRITPQQLVGNVEYGQSLYKNIASDPVVTSYGDANLAAVFEAQTNTTDTSTDTEIMKFVRGNYDILCSNYDANSLYFFDVEIIASSLDGSFARALGIWHGKVYRSPQATDVTAEFVEVFTHINAGMGVNLFTTTPSFAFNTTSGLLEITVAHTGVTTLTFNVAWQCYIKGQRMTNMELTC